MSTAKKNIHLDAAVVGMWRCGAEPIQIAVYTGLLEVVVKKIIKDYQLKIKKDGIK